MSRRPPAPDGCAATRRQTGKRVVECDVLPTSLSTLRPQQGSRAQPGQHGKAQAAVQREAMEDAHRAAEGHEEPESHAGQGHRNGAIAAEWRVGAEIERQLAGQGEHGAGEVSLDRRRHGHVDAHAD